MDILQLSRMNKASMNITNMRAKTLKIWKKIEQRCLDKKATERALLVLRR